MSDTLRGTASTIGVMNLLGGPYPRVFVEEGTPAREVQDVLAVLPTGFSSGGTDPEGAGLRLIGEDGRLQQDLEAASRHVVFARVPHDIYENNDRFHPGYVIGERTVEPTRIGRALLRTPQLTELLVSTWYGRDHLLRVTIPSSVWQAHKARSPQEIEALPERSISAHSASKLGFLVLSPRRNESIAGAQRCEPISRKAVWGEPLKSLTGEAMASYGVKQHLERMRQDFQLSDPAGTE